MVKFYRKSITHSDLWVTSHDKLSDFYASSWQPGEAPVPLLVMRLILASAALGILVWSVTVSPTPTWLVFLTNWGLVLVAMTTLNGLVLSCIALCRKNMDGDGLPWFVSTYWFLFNVSVTIAIVITALYWILIYDPEPEDPESHDLWLDIGTHAVNSLIMLAELLATRTPIRFLHLYQPLGMGLCYAAFSAIYYVAGGTVNGFPYIYEVLDWRQAKRAGAIVGGAAAGVIIIYAFLWGLALCRDKISTSLIRTTSHDLAPVPPDRHMA